MKKIKLNDKRVVVICYILLFGILGLFHSLIGLYFDDYGNASLSYGYDAGVTGMQWTLKDLASWAHWIYFNFSGRILCGSLLNFLIKIGNGPKIFMAVQTCIVWSLFVVMYRIILYVTRQKCNLYLSVAIVALFFLMPSDMYRWNLCWASASVLYIWPLLPFFTAVFLQLQLDNEEMSSKRKFLYTVICFICILFTAFSHEQTGLSIAVYMVGYLILKKISDKKLSVRNIVFSCSAVITYGFLFGAPGNWNRLDGNTEFAGLSFFGKIAYNYRPLMECLFNLHFCLVYLLITVGLTVLAYKKYKKSEKKLPLIIAIVSFILIAGVILAIIAGLTTVWLVLAPVYLLSVFILLLLYNSDNQQQWENVLLIAAAASAFCVLISPALPMRCFTEWILIIYIILLQVVYDVWKVYQCGGRMVKVGYCVIFLALCILAAKEFGMLSLGYAGNKAMLEDNDKILQDSKDKSVIYLNKLANDFYAPAMPYHEGFEYIEYWMKEYYGLDQAQEFIWTCNSLIHEETEGDFYHDNWFGKEGKIVIDEKCWADTLHFKVYLPDDVKEQDLQIVVNDKTMEEYHIEHGMNDISVNLKFGKRNTVYITAPAAYVHGEQDSRELSVVLTYYFE